MLLLVFIGITVLSRKAVCNKCTAAKLFDCCPCSGVASRRQGTGSSLSLWHTPCRNTSEPAAAVTTNSQVASCQTSPAPAPATAYSALPQFCHHASDAPHQHWKTTLLAIGDAGAQPWTDDDLESMQKGVVMTATLAFKAVLELGQRQLCVRLDLIIDTTWGCKGHACCACCYVQGAQCCAA